LGFRLQLKGGTMRSTRALLAIAIAIPPVLGVIFVPFFLRAQSWGRPVGNLEGLDLTSFAERDAWMMRSFAWVLFIVIIATGLAATSWRNRLVIIAAGGLAALVSYVAVFASLLAG
jgi:hypothetical protein